MKCFCKGVNRGFRLICDFRVEILNNLSDLKVILVVFLVSRDWSRLEGFSRCGSLRMSGIALTFWSKTSARKPLQSHTLHASSNYRLPDCLAPSLLMSNQQIPSPFYDGNSPVTDGFPSQRTSNVESVFTSWGQHGKKIIVWISFTKSVPSLNVLLGCSEIRSHLQKMSSAQQKHVQNVWYLNIIKKNNPLCSRYHATRCWDICMHSDGNFRVLCIYAIGSILYLYCFFFKSAYFCCNLVNYDSPGLFSWL